jgi:hypothetical protein
MTSGLNEALREAMDAATRTVEPSSTLTADVVRGGRRRRRRRQAGMTALVVVVVAAGLSAPSLLRSSVSDRRVPPATAVGDDKPAAPKGPFYHWPTRGGLAGNAALRAKALKEWADPIGRDVASFAPVPNPIGSPRFLWLGQTAAGPAVVMAQDYGAPDGGGPAGVWGSVWRVMVADAQGRLRTTGESGGLDDDPDVITFVVNPVHPQLVVLPARTDATVRYATRHRIGTDGKVVRTMDTLPLAGGVGMATIPAGQPMDTLVEVRLAGRTVARGPVQSAPIAMYDRDPRKGWLSVCSPCSPGSKAPKSWHGSDPFQDDWTTVWLKRHGAQDEYAVPGDWALRGWTGDGEAVIGFQLQLHGDPMSTVIALRRSYKDRLAVGDIVYDRVVDEKSPLPVRARLPRGQGWLVVANRGAVVQWKAPGGRWRHVTGLAALLPNTSGITVAVTLNGVTTKVTLDRA